MEKSSAKNLRYRFGPFELDPDEGSLARNGTRIKLQDLPLRLLAMLLERPGEIVTREQVRQHLWPENTFVEFDNSLGVAIRKIRDSLGDDAEAPRYVETVPRRGYRFIAPVQKEDGEREAASAAVKPVAVGETVAELEVEHRRSRRKEVALVLILGVAVIAVWFWRSQVNKRIPERAAVVVGEFSNKTGDPLFDGSLRRAVIIQLTQSPYLSLLTDEQLGAILQDLGRSPDEALSTALAREVCQRGHGAALISGTIQSTGGVYQLTMEASRCSDGSELARETLSVDNQKQVLPQLGGMVDDLRRSLGESRESLQRFDVPVEQATTSSLEALKAYQLGLELRAHSKNLEARPILKTAITLDPTFAIAYAQLGSSYSNLGNTAESKQYFQKAFELRARATEPERLYITGRYFDIVTGETEKGSETYKLWTELYPNDWKPYNAVANDAFLLGRYETVVDAARQAVRLGPNQDFGSSNLVGGLIALNRLEEAKKVCDQMMAQGHDNAFLHLDRFAIAVLQKDDGGMEREREWGRKQPNDADMVYVEAQWLAANGKVKESTKLFEKVAKMNLAHGDAESAATALSVAGEVNSEMGWSAIALKESEAALKLGKNEIVLGVGAIIAARAQNLSKEQELLRVLDHDYPLATFNLGVFSPMIRTMMAVEHGSSQTEVASLMEPALPYEYGFEADMLPIYVRGESYLAVHAPEEAEREFQKILDHHSVDAVTTLYPLAELGLARAYALEGKKDESRKAYEQYFAVEKDADKDLPILVKARQEFRALK